MSEILLGVDAVVQQSQVTMEPEAVAQWAAELEGSSPEGILSELFERVPPGQVAFCTSFQMDGMAIIDMAWRVCPQIRVLTIDTGRLPDATYAMMDLVRDRYGVPVEVVLPRPEDVQPMVHEHGVNLFYASEELRQTCCDVRKVRPLRRLLRGFDAWVTGVRRDQATTRARVPIVDLDWPHGGILKVNPLAAWTEEMVADYVECHNVPLHPLYRQGYTSIGCGPCTRATEPGEDPRAGRWWWETSALKECGIHFSPNGSITRDKDQPGYTSYAI